MPRDGRYDDLTAFLDARGDALLRTAVLLAPGSETGEDLLQEALERLLRKWHKVDGDPESYLRRIMYNRAVDGWRRQARRREVLGLPVEPAVGDHASRLELRLALVDALELLTPRQRAAIVALLGTAQRGRDGGSAGLLDQRGESSCCARPQDATEGDHAVYGVRTDTSYAGSRTMTRYGADLGDSDPGTALRLSMSAAVSDIRMPAELLDRAASRNRKRNARKFLAGGVCAVAAVATVATVVATAPGPSSGQPAARRQTAGLQAQTAAYVLNRAAAAQVNSYRMISVDQSAGGGVIYTDVATQQQRIVSSLLDSAGQPYFQIATAISGRAYRETDIEYQHHVYSTFTTSSMDHGVRVTLSSFLSLQTNHNPTIAFNKALKAGIIKVVGHRNLNGRDTILVTIKSPYRSKARPARAVNRSKQGMAISVPPASSIWLDASNYLVVQTQHFVPHFPRNFRPSEAGSKTTWSPVIDHVTWLRPTGGNLGLLTLTPPAGFAKISYSELAKKYLGPIS